MTTEEWNQALDREIHCDLLSWYSRLRTPAEFAEDFCACYDVKDFHQGIQPEGHGSVMHEEGRLLAGFARKHGGPVLEIGACLGISSRYIYDGLETGSLYSIDPRHQNVAAGPRHYLLHCRAEQWQVKEGMRWAFVDGDHRYAAVFEDAGIAVRAGCKDIIFHDTSDIIPPATGESCGSDARRAVLDFFRDKRSEWSVGSISTHCGLMHAHKH